MEDLDLTEAEKDQLRKRQIELVKVIESFEKLEKSKEWESVKELVFDKSLAAIEKQIMNESLAPKIDADKLYKLQGEWAWAKQYSDLNRFIYNLKNQLIEIKKKI